MTVKFYWPGVAFTGSGFMAGGLLLTHTSRDSHPTTPALTHSLPPMYHSIFQHGNGMTITGKPSPAIFSVLAAYKQKFPPLLFWRLFI